jgi:hypothetical protein
MKRLIVATVASGLMIGTASACTGLLSCLFTSPQQEANQAIAFCRNLGATGDALVRCVQNEQAMQLQQRQSSMDRFERAAQSMQNIDRPMNTTSCGWLAGNWVCHSN